MTRRRMLELVEAFNDGVPKWMIAFAVLVTVGILLTLAGCAGPALSTCHDGGVRPYTHERPTVPFKVTVGNGPFDNAWSADGAPTVLTVHNPTDRLLLVHVICEPSVEPHQIDRGHDEWWTCMAPHQEKRRLVEFMNVDAISQVCFVKEAYAQRRNDCAGFDAHDADE